MKIQPASILWFFFPFFSILLYAMLFYFLLVTQGITFLILCVEQFVGGLNRTHVIFEFIGIGLMFLLALEGLTNKLGYAKHQFLLKRSIPSKTKCRDFALSEDFLYLSKPFLKNKAGTFTTIIYWLIILSIVLFQIHVAQALCLNFVLDSTYDFMPQKFILNEILQPKIIRTCLLFINWTLVTFFSLECASGYMRLILEKTRRN